MPLWQSGATETIQTVAALDLRLVLVWCDNNSLQSTFVSCKVNNLQTIRQRGCDA